MNEPVYKNLIIDGIPEDSDFYRLGEENKLLRIVSDYRVKKDQSIPNATQRINGVWHDQRWEDGQLIWSKPAK